MTVETVLVLARLKELHALARVRRAIASNAVDADWAYVLAAIDTQRYALQKLLEQDDPQVVRDCEALMEAPPPLQKTVIDNGLSAALPKGAIVH